MQYYEKETTEYKNGYLYIKNIKAKNFLNQ